MASERLKHMNEPYASKRFAHLPLEIDMTKSPTILTRRGIFRAGDEPAAAGTATPLLTPASGRAEDARQGGEITSDVHYVPAGHSPFHSAMTMATTIKVNGVDQTVDIDGDMPLLWVLRDVLGMTGTKFGCGMALCGACTVHVDGVATRSCVTRVDSIEGAEITTIEAIGATPVGARIQQAWLDLEVVQCGYCQPGQIMSAADLLANNPDPTDSDIDDAMSGNICRCGTYLRIREAIKHAAQTGGQGG